MSAAPPASPASQANSSVLVVGGLPGDPQSSADLLPGPAPWPCPLDLDSLGLLEEAAQHGNRDETRLGIAPPCQGHQLILSVCLVTHDCHT